MKEKFSIIQSVMRNRTIAFLITGALLLFGIFALLNMPRQEFPEFTVRQGLVIGVYPGATSRQVEEQLTSEIENFLFEFKEVKRSKTYSVSKEGMVVVFVELADEVNNADQFWSKLRHGLNQLKTSLPPEVLALIANSEFGDTSAMILTLESESKSYKELEVYLKQLKNELRKNSAVSKIKDFGLQKEEISIYINQDKLAHYGIKPVMLLAALKSEGSVSFGGEIDNGKLVQPIHLGSRYQSEKDIEEQIVYSDPFGNVVRLKDIASIRREYPEPDSYVLNNGKKCILVSLEMRYGNNIVTFGEEIDKIIEKYSKSLPEDVKLNKIANMPEVVAHSINDFLKEFFIAIIAVILVTMLLLPKKVAAIAGITIPISIFIALGALYLLKIELHTVSLAALIVVLGMVVDNSIVVIDNHLEKLDSGLSPFEAAWKSAKELFIPVFSATIILVVFFFPLMLFLHGTYYDFIKPFPISIGITLGISLAVAVLLVPILNFVLVKKGLKDKQSENSKRTFLDVLQNYYDRSLEWAFTKKKIIIIIGIGSIIAAVLLSGFVKRQLFPFIERNQFAVEVYLPSGTSLNETSIIADSLQKVFLSEKRIINCAAFVGTSSPRFHATYAPNFPAKNYAQFVITTESNKASDELINEYSKKFFNHFPKAHIKWKQLELSDKTAAIEVRISGDSLKNLKGFAENVTGILKSTPGINWVRNDFEEDIQGVTLNINRDEANRLGFTKSVIAYSLVVGFKGFPLATIWEGDYPVSVMLKTERDRIETYDDIRNEYVSSPFLMSTVRLRQIAEPEADWSEGAIVRRNGVRTLTVRADVDKGLFVSDVFAQAKLKIDQLQTPDGINFEYGGEFEGETENYTPMAYSLLTSIVIAFFILLFQFRKIKLSLLVLITMPLSLFGAIIGLFVTNYPFGFTCFVGIISLCGIVIRNGIIYVDYAEELRTKKGVSAVDAAIAAGKRRMRPIFLTSAAASIGVVPMMASGSSLWGPLATVICFGLLFSMVLTLYVLPVLYQIFNRKEKPSVIKVEA